MRHKPSSDHKIQVKLELRCFHAPTTNNEAGIVWGKTPSGQRTNAPCPPRMTLIRARTVFKVPTTHHTLTLFEPTYPKSPFALLNFALLGAHVLLCLIWPFVWSFALWRAVYNAGLSGVLTQVDYAREVQKRGWLDADCGPRLRAWIHRQLRQDAQRLRL